MIDPAQSPNGGNDYPLLEIYFYLTEGCNLACRHCWLAPKRQTESRTYPSLDVELFCNIVAQGRLLGIQGVKLTGGEPFLHPEIVRILDFIRQEELRLNIETNGVLCTRDVARRIAACKGAFISVSLDGATAQIHDYIRGVAGSFDRAVEGIRNLSQEGLKPQIVMSILRSNKDYLEETVRLAESLNADSVKFNVVQPAGRGLKAHKDGLALGVEELIELGRWVEEELATTTPLRLLYTQPIAFTSMSSILGSRGEGCNGCGILGIIGVLADGSYALCGVGHTVRDLVFGNARVDRLEDVWNTADVLLRLRQGLPAKLEGVCGDCLVSGICLGHCIAQNYYQTANLMSAFWYCEEARNKGVFPKSRIRSCTH